MPTKQPDPSRERVLEALAAIDCEERVFHDPGPSEPDDDEPAIAVVDQIKVIEKAARKIADILRDQDALDIPCTGGAGADDRHEARVEWLQGCLTERIWDAAKRPMFLRIQKVMEASNG